MTETPTLAPRTTKAHPADPTAVVVNAEGDFLSAPMAASYFRLLAAGMPDDGIDVFGRTMDDQWAVYRRYLKGGPLAAYPNKNAPHVKSGGTAVDFHTTTAGRYAPSAAFLFITRGTDGSKAPRDTNDAKMFGHEHGWYRTVPGERWHCGYVPEKDKHAAADIDARLKYLGYANLKEFQKAHKLTADGVAGPMTWKALLVDPKPKPVEVPAVSLNFDVGEYNAQMKRWGGGSYTADAKFVKNVLNCSVFLGCEMEEACRDAVVAENGYKVWAYKTLGVFWSPDKYNHGARIELDLKTNYHGLIGTELTSILEPHLPSFVAAAIHVRPKDAFPSSWSDAKKLAGKRGDIKKIIAKLAKYPRVIVAGDWNTGDAKALLLAAGYKPATPLLDTNDAAGVQRLDGIWVRGLEVREDGTIHPTPASDHHGLRGKVRLLAVASSN